MQNSHQNNYVDSMKTQFHIANCYWQHCIYHFFFYHSQFFKFYLKEHFTYFIYTMYILCICFNLLLSFTVREQLSFVFESITL
jgi:hypothetical protein